MRYFLLTDEARGGIQILHRELPIGSSMRRELMGFALASTVKAPVDLLERSGISIELLSRLKVVDDLGEQPL